MLLNQLLLMDRLTSTVLVVNRNKYCVYLIRINFFAFNKLNNDEIYLNNTIIIYIYIKIDLRRSIISDDIYIINTNHRVYFSCKKL